MDKPWPDAGKEFDVFFEKLRHENAIADTPTTRLIATSAWDAAILFKERINQ